MPIPEGTYKMISSDKFDEYMVAVGVSFLTRKMAGTITPVTEIKKLGEDEYLIKTSSTFKTTELKFKLGQQFSEETADGRKCLSTITLENDHKMKHVQLCGEKDKKMELVMYREFVGDKMNMTLEAPGVVCTRIYEKQK